MFFLVLNARKIDSYIQTNSYPIACCKSLFPLFSVVSFHTKTWLRKVLGFSTFG